MSFLKGLFGPSKEEIWSQLSREVGGEFQQGGFLSGKTSVQAKSRAGRRGRLGKVGTRDPIAQAKM